MSCQSKALSNAKQHQTGAAVGAATGAAIGTAVFPVVGTAIGAIGGLIGGLFGGKKKSKSCAVAAVDPTAQITSYAQTLYKMVQGAQQKDAALAQENARLAAELKTAQQTQIGMLLIGAVAVVVILNRK
jgi:hypothetical protein